MNETFTSWVAPPPAKASIIETLNDFYAWLDGATDEQERVEEDQSS